MKCTECGQDFAPDEEEICHRCQLEEAFEQYIPEGHYIVEDADGERFVKKDKPGAEAFEGQPSRFVCDKCGMSRIHSRLKGYQCPRCD